MANLFVEEPFWLMLVLTLLSIGSLVMACAGAGRWLFGVAAVLFASIIGVFFVERLVETDREKITADVYQLANAVEANDVDAALEHFHPSMATTLGRVRLEMPKYDFRSCNVTSVSDIAFDDQMNPSKGVVEVRVFVNVDASRSEFRIKDAMAPRVVMLTYEKDSKGDWKVSDYRHYDPRGRDSLGRR